MIMICKMKTLAFAALFYAVTLPSLHGTPGVQAETTSCDESSTEQCNSESTSSSSSPKEDGYPVPKAMKLIKTIVYDEPTVSGV